MSLFTEDVYVDIHARGNIMTVEPVKSEVYKGFRKAKRETVKFLNLKNTYVVACFYKENGNLIKEIRVEKDF